MNDEPEPAELRADLDWLDWAPGSQPLFRRETPRQWMERKERRRTRWRAFLARFGAYPKEGKT